MLIIHEVMGRNWGWLTAATAAAYPKLIAAGELVPGLGLRRERVAVHGIVFPEMAFDIPAETERLKRVMDAEDNVSLFVSKGAGVETIVAELQSRGQEVPRDAFGHVKLDAVNPGKWFGDQFAKMVGAEKVLVQKSGYFARAAATNTEDLRLIKSCVDLAVDCALRRESGVIGHDDDHQDVLRAIECSRIKGGKPFDIGTPWFTDLLASIDQPRGRVVAARH